MHEASLAGGILRVVKQAAEREHFRRVGAIGFDGRWDYGAIGTVTNLAARLCGEAEANQILVSQRVHASVESLLDVEPQQMLTLKGFQRPVGCFRVRGFKAAAA